MSTEAPPEAAALDLEPCPFCQVQMRWNEAEEPPWKPYWDHPGGRMGETPASECWLADACITPGEGEGSAAEWNRRAARQHAEPQGKPEPVAREDLVWRNPAPNAAPPSAPSGKIVQVQYLPPAYPLDHPSALSAKPVATSPSAGKKS